MFYLKKRYTSLREAGKSEKFWNGNQIATGNTATTKKSVVSCVVCGNIIMYTFPVKRLHVVWNNRGYRYDPSVPKKKQGMKVE
ncbi:MAG: hypothetical protein ABIS69_00845 [Sediminibacterium sp.]